MTFGTLYRLIQEPQSHGEGNPVVVFLQNLTRIFLAERFHAAYEHVSNLENLKVAGSEFNASFSKRDHNVPTATFPIRVRTKFDPVARALKDSASLVWS